MVYGITIRLAGMKALIALEPISEDLESKKFSGGGGGGDPTLMCTLTHTPPPTVSPP